VPRCIGHRSLRGDAFSSATPLPCAREQRLLVQFLALSPRAQAYREGLEAKRVNARIHLRKILALAEMHGREAVARAMDDGLDLRAFSAEYIAHILAARATANSPRWTATRACAASCASTPPRTC